MLVKEEFEDRFQAVAYLKKHNKQKMYYVYMMFDGTEPFYVGISQSNRRLYEHEKNADKQRTGHNPFKNNKILKMKANNVPIRYMIIGYFHSAIEANHAERSLILFYGKRCENNGILTNIIDGGDGACGRRLTEEHRIAISTANKGKPKSEETLKRLSNSLKKAFENREGTFKGKTHTEETKLLMSQNKSGENHPQFGRRGEMSHNFGRKRSPEAITKIKEGIAKTDTTCTEERKRKLSDYWDNQPLLVCPYCGKESTFKAAMVRHHFDKCKHRLPVP